MCSGLDLIFDYCYSIYGNNTTFYFWPYKSNNFWNSIQIVFTKLTLQISLPTIKLWDKFKKLQWNILVLVIRINLIIHIQNSNVLMGQVSFSIYKFVLICLLYCYSPEIKSSLKIRVRQAKTYHCKCNCKWLSGKIGWNLETIRFFIQTFIRKSQLSDIYENPFDCFVSTSLQLV